LLPWVDLNVITAAGANDNLASEQQLAYLSQSLQSLSVEDKLASAKRARRAYRLQFKAHQASAGMQAKAMAGGESKAPAGPSEQQAPADYGAKYQQHMGTLQKQLEEAKNT